MAVHYIWWGDAWVEVGGGEPGPGPDPESTPASFLAGIGNPGYNSSEAVVSAIRVPEGTTSVDTVYVGILHLGSSVPTPEGWEQVFVSTPLGDVRVSVFAKEGLTDESPALFFPTPLGRIGWAAVTVKDAGAVSSASREAYDDGVGVSPWEGTTILTENCMLLLFGGARYNFITNSDVMEKGLDVHGNGGLAAFYEENLLSGSYGPVTFTPSYGSSGFRLAELQIAPKAVIAPTVPDQITDVTTIEQDGHVIVEWDPPHSRSSPLLEYVVERAPDDSGVPGSWTVIQDGSTTQLFGDSGVTNGNTYWYRITAVNEEGPSNPSDPVSATPDEVSLPGGIDSFALSSTDGPITAYEGGDGSSIQVWGRGHIRGFSFTPTESVLLHGVRTWHPGLGSGDDETIIVHHTIHIGSPVPGSPPIASMRGYAGFVPEHGWSTHMFDEPIELDQGVEYCVYICSNSTASIPIPRNASMFTDNEESLNGLLFAEQPTSHYTTDHGEVCTPPATADAWYWIDPLVTSNA